MSNKNERIIKIISENFQNYKDQAQTLCYLDQSIQDKLKLISRKLIPFIKKNCNEQFRELLTKYDIIDSTESGTQFSPKGEEDMKLVNQVERCVDKHFGLNKKIMMFELDSKNIIAEDDDCKRNCIKFSDKMDDTDLINCLRKCYDKFYSDYTQVISNYESDLNKINLRI
jgi:hypothetical protein